MWIFSESGAGTFQSYNDIAGFYPPSFEYAFMVGYSHSDLPQSWLDYIPFILGPESYDQKQLRFFQHLNDGLLALHKFYGEPDTESVEDEEARAKIIGQR